MHEALFLPKSKTAYSKHAEVALYSSVLLVYPYLLCDIKMRLLLLEFLLPGCEVLQCHCPGLQRRRGMKPPLLARSLMLHRGAKKGCDFMVGSFFFFFLFPSL